MPSIIGSKSCCAVNNRPAPTCAGTLAFALFFIRRLLFSHLGSGVVADPFSRSAWSRRYLLKFEFQQGVGHRPFARKLRSAAFKVSSLFKVVGRTRMSILPLSRECA